MWKLLFLLGFSACITRDVQVKSRCTTLQRVESLGEWDRNGWKEKKVQYWLTEDGVLISLVYPYDTPYNDTVGTVRRMFLRL